MDPALRELVRDRAGARCEYCHLPQQFSELQFRLEHILPRQHGGSDNAENLALACPECNLLKGPNLTGVDPTTQRVVRLFHARRDKLTEHFPYVRPVHFYFLLSLAREIFPLFHGATFHFS